MDHIEQEFYSQISNPNNSNNNIILASAEQQHTSNNNNESAEHALFRGSHNSSRIFRVSRASGGKDRHSKVLTSKGLRDRRVRLSVSTAIQFYDLQDRLGYDQPSKAVEWLIKAATDSITELPSLHGPFPDCTGIVEQQQKNQNLSASSTSETSKGSLTQSDVRVNQRVKARERARERAKEKESTEQVVNVGQRRRSPISSSSTATFTELLTGGNHSGSSPNNISVPVMDYFMTNAAGARSNANAFLFLGQSQMGNNMPPAFHLTTGDHHQEQFSFGNEQLYDLNFTISSSSPSGFATGYINRGTLQSNSTMHQNLQRYSMEGSSSVPAAAFFMTNSAAANSLNNNSNLHHHFSTGLDGGLHLYYGDHKDKGGKN